jgi:hypothetical protein
MYAIKSKSEDLFFSGMKYDYRSYGSGSIFYHFDYNSVKFFGTENEALSFIKELEETPSYLKLFPMQYMAKNSSSTKELIVVSFEWSA